MREVSILFINLSPNYSLSSTETLKLLQNSFKIIQETLSTHHGKTVHTNCIFECIIIKTKIKQNNRREKMIGKEKREKKKIINK